VPWSQVTVSELPGRTGVLRDNVITNVPDRGVVVKEYVWGTVGSTTAWGLVEDLGSEWDFITGSDLVYSDESTPDLVCSRSLYLCVSLTLCIFVFMYLLSFCHSLSTTCMCTDYPLLV
jgi:hypothetical protein